MGLLPVLLLVAFVVPLPYMVLSPMSFGATWRKNFRRVGSAAQIMRRLASTMLERNYVLAMYTCEVTK